MSTNGMNAAAKEFVPMGNNNMTNNMTTSSIGNMVNNRNMGNNNASSMNNTIGNNVGMNNGMNNTMSNNGMKNMMSNNGQNSTLNMPTAMRATNSGMTTGSGMVNANNANCGSMGTVNANNANNSNIDFDFLNQVINFNMPGVPGGMNGVNNAGMNSGGINNGGMNNAGMNNGGMNNAGMNNARMNSGGINNAGIMNSLHTLIDASSVEENSPDQKTDKTDSEQKKVDNGNNGNNGKNGAKPSYSIAGNLEGPTPSSNGSISKIDKNNNPNCPNRSANVFSLQLEREYLFPEEMYCGLILDHDRIICGGLDCHLRVFGTDRLRNLLGIPKLEKNKQKKYMPTAKDLLADLGYNYVERTTGTSIGSTGTPTPVGSTGTLSRPVKNASSTTLTTSTDRFGSTDQFRSTGDQFGSRQRANSPVLYDSKRNSGINFVSPSSISSGGPVNLIINHDAKVIDAGLLDRLADTMKDDEAHYYEYYTRSDNVKSANKGDRYVRPELHKVISVDSDIEHGIDRINGRINGIDRIGNENGNQNGCGNPPLHPDLTPETIYTPKKPDIFSSVHHANEQAKYDEQFRLLKERQAQLLAANENLDLTLNDFRWDS